MDTHTNWKNVSISLNDALPVNDKFIFKNYVSQYVLSDFIFINHVPEIFKIIQSKIHFLTFGTSIIRICIHLCTFLFHLIECKNLFKYKKHVI